MIINHYSVINRKERCTYVDLTEHCVNHTAVIQNTKPKFLIQSIPFDQKKYILSIPESQLLTTEINLQLSFTQSILIEFHSQIEADQLS